MTPSSLGRTPRRPRTGLFQPPPLVRDGGSGWTTQRLCLEVARVPAGVGGGERDKGQEEKAWFRVGRGVRFEGVAAPDRPPLCPATPLSSCGSAAASRHPVWVKAAAPASARAPLSQAVAPDGPGLVLPLTSRSQVEGLATEGRGRKVSACCSSYNLFFCSEFLHVENSLFYFLVLMSHP